MWKRIWHISTSLFNIKFHLQFLFPTNGVSSKSLPLGFFSFYSSFSSPYSSTPADWSVSFFRQFRTTIRSPRTATVTRSTCPPTVVFRSYPVRLPTATQRDEQPQGRENLQPFSPIPLTLTTARAPEFSGIQERNWKRDGGARRGDRDSCIRVGRCSESTGYSWKNGDGGGVRSGDEYRCCDTGVVTNECMGWFDRKCYNGHFFF